MAKKEITSQFKLQAPGGNATPAPPIGPALGQHGVNPGQFISQFNERTSHLNGKPVTCVITVYKDRTFEFEVKSPPASVLIKEAANIDKGASLSQRENVASITEDQLRQIAEEKGAELTGHDRDAVVKSLAGTARSMGVAVEGNV
jgi:large subunit ribosomal protein L11